MERGQLVTFRLGGETYGVEILKVREVIHFREVTEIPNATSYVEGVIQLRDEVIPVVEMRERLGVAGRDGGRKRIVSLEAGRPLGVIVDDISGVLQMDPSQIEPLPEVLEAEGRGSCFSSMVKGEDGLIILISPEKILTTGEQKKLDRCHEVKEWDVDSVQP